MEFSRTINKAKLFDEEEVKYGFDFHRQITGICAA